MLILANKLLNKVATLTNEDIFLKRRKATIVFELFATIIAFS